MTAPAHPQFAGETLEARCAELTAQLAEARETNRRLNRRCQLAERVADEKLMVRVGPNYGRGLANYAAAMFERERDELTAQLAALSALPEGERARAAVLLSVRGYLALKGHHDAVEDLEEY